MIAFTHRHGQSVYGFVRHAISSLYLSVDDAYQAGRVSNAFKIPSAPGFSWRGAR